MPEYPVLVNANEVTVFDEVLIMDINGDSVLVTYALVPSGVIAIPLGPSPTGIVGAITVFMAMWIITTVSLPPIVT